MLSTPAPLAEAHDLSAFESGVAPLDDWLKRRARANHVGGASRVYVAADGDGRVFGYYALASGALAPADESGRIRRNMPDPIPMAILGRLAVDRSWQGKGMGAAMLRDAVLRADKAAAIIGLRGILVHAISQDAKRFYENHGFMASPTQHMTLMLPLPQQSNAGPD
jgi:GNAT superfamily N-acetyltransferase